MRCRKRRGDSAGQVPLRANPVKYQKFNMSLGNPITAVYTEKSERILGLLDIPQSEGEMSKRLGGGIKLHSKSPNFSEAVVSRCRLSEGFLKSVRVCPGINVRFLCTTNTHSSRWVHKHLVNNISI